MRRFLGTALLLCMTFALQSGSRAALDVYVKIKGQRQGEIKGDVLQKGREGQIAASEFRHEIISPRDAASGLPTGKRMHKPIVFVTEVGKAYPALWNALVTNENLTEVVFNFWKPQLRSAIGVGTEVNYMTITLKNANISRITTVSPNNKNPEFTRYAAYAEVELTYQNITIENKETGTTVQDTWGGSMKAESNNEKRAVSAARAQAKLNRSRRLSLR